MKHAALLLLLSAFGLAKTPQSVSVHPANPMLFGKGARQALIVVAHYADGSEEDVTPEAHFTSLKPAVVTVDGTGMITGGHGAGMQSLGGQPRGIIVTPGTRA